MRLALPDRAKITASLVGGISPESPRSYSLAPEAVTRNPEFFQDSGIRGRSIDTTAGRQTIVQQVEYSPQIPNTFVRLVSKAHSRNRHPPPGADFFRLNFLLASVINTGRFGKLKPAWSFRVRLRGPDSREEKNPEAPRSERGREGGGELQGVRRRGRGLLGRKPDWAYAPSAHNHRNPHGNRCAWGVSPLCGPKFRAARNSGQRLVIERQLVTSRRAAARHPARNQGLADRRDCHNCARCVRRGQPGICGNSSAGLHR